MNRESGQKASSIKLGVFGGLKRILDRANKVWNCALTLCQQDLLEDVQLREPMRGKKLRELVVGVEKVKVNQCQGRGEAVLEMVENYNLEKLGIFLKNEEIEFMAGKLGIQLLFVVKAQGVPLEQEIELFQSEPVGADREKEREHLRERVKELQIVTCG